jgi:hypothetical protein
MSLSRRAPQHANAPEHNKTPERNRRPYTLRHKGPNGLSKYPLLSSMTGKHNRNNLQAADNGGLTPL